MRLLPALALVFLSCILATHGAGPPTPRTAPTAAAEHPKPEAQKSAPKPAVKTATDTELERGIRARFARSKISVNGFTVRVENGVAVIEGKTGIIQHKGTATRLARLAGARRIDNRIEIPEAARQKAAGSLGKRAHVQSAGN